jgi:hypothetical protein
MDCIEITTKGRADRKDNIGKRKPGGTALREIEKQDIRRTSLYPVRF